MPVSAIIFDFDGVLADTERLHLAAFQQVFAERGWRLDEATYFNKYLGYDDEGLVRAFSKDGALELEESAVTHLVGEKTRVFSQHLSRGDVLFPDAATCVSALARALPLAIASGALRSEITAILRAGGLLDYFQVIVAADDVDECKPSPVPYLTAAARLGVDPSACLAVEDSLPGVQAAKAAGMRTIALATTSPKHVLTAADEVIDGLEELSLDLVLTVARGR